MPYCYVCGKRIPRDKVAHMTKNIVCSKECMYASVNLKPLKILNLVIVGVSVICLLAAFLGYLLDKIDPLMWFIIPGSIGILFLTVLVPILYFEYCNIKKYKAKAKNIKFYCPFCEAETEKPEDDGPIICMTCGKKTPMCQICGERIMGEEEGCIFEPCGHYAHKDEVWKWLEKNEKCPLCKEIIQKIDVDLIKSK